MNIKDALNTAWSEYQQSNICQVNSLGEAIVSDMIIDKIVSLAQTLINNEERQELERLRVNLKRFEPPSDKQLNYLRNLVKIEANTPIVLAYLKEKGIDQIPRLSCAQCSELIDSLVKKEESK